MSAASRKGAKLEHFVSSEPFDPHLVDHAVSPEQERFYLASQWKLMWWKFKRHRLAVVSGVFLLLTYFSILISEFLAPYGLQTRNVDFIFSPPQSVHLFHEGAFVGPFVYDSNYKLNMQNLKREYTEDKSRIHPLRFFLQRRQL